MVLLFIYCSANSQTTNTAVLNNYKTDYSNIDLWAAHPWKKDNADSIPKDLQLFENLDSSVDVFFIHPTTYTGKRNDAWNASFEDELLNKRTDQSTILYQASVFNNSCRVFSPRYQQAHIECFYIEKDLAKPFFDYAYDDIKSAFEYYLAHYNKGRPIIIAGHSQGTIHAARLLNDYFDNKPLLKKLVAAYLIGMPIPLNYFSSIKLCEHKDETGCYVSWRTFVKGYEPEFAKNEKESSGVVNPLNWEINKSELINKEYNKGGILKNFNKVIKHVVDAEIHDNILWSCKPNIFGKIFIRKKNFHIGDINLFYLNIRDNIRERISRYKLDNKEI
jgi:hypothetical protein